MVFSRCFAFEKLAQFIQYSTHNLGFWVDLSNPSYFLGALTVLNQERSVCGVMFINFSMVNLFAGEGGFNPLIADLCFSEVGHRKDTGPPK